MRAERVLRNLGLSLVLLFPLLSLLQLSDGEGKWRRAADLVRPSVLVLHRADARGAPLEAEVVGSGIVVQSDPLRVVTAAPSVGLRLSSHLPDGWVQWTTIYSDVHGEFSILQAESDLYAETQGAASFIHAALPVAPLDFAHVDESRDGLRVALVGPGELEVEELWIGVLSLRESVRGRRSYHSDLLHPIRSYATLAAVEAQADPLPRIDPALQGAPFVNEDGLIIALYQGLHDQGVKALPIEIVARTLVLLHLQAAH